MNILCKLFGHKGGGFSKADDEFYIMCHNRMKMQDAKKGLIEGETVFYGQTSVICMRCGYERNITKEFFPKENKKEIVNIWKNFFENEIMLHPFDTEETTIGYKGENAWDAGVIFMRPPKNIFEGICNYFHNLFHPYD